MNETKFSMALAWGTDNEGVSMRKNVHSYWINSVLEIQYIRKKNKLQILVPEIYKKKKTSYRFFINK